MWLHMAPGQDRLKQKLHVQGKRCVSMFRGRICVCAQGQELSPCLGVGAVCLCLGALCLFLGAGVRCLCSG